MRRFGIFPVRRHTGTCYLPFLCFACPENLPEPRCRGTTAARHHRREAPPPRGTTAVRHHHPLPTVRCGQWAATVNTSALELWPQAAQGHTPTLDLDPPLKKRHVCGKLIVGLAHSACNSAPRQNFLNVFKYCFRGPLTAIYSKSIHQVACHGIFKGQV